MAFDKRTAGEVHEVKDSGAMSPIGNTDVDVSNPNPSEKR